MSDSGDSNRASEGSSPSAPQDSSPLKRVADFMMSNKMEAGLWILRMVTVFSTITFFLPILGGSPMSIYQRALLSSAATSALRVHQRMPSFQLSRAYFSQLFLEDSAHYLFYSLIFLYISPVTMVLVPVFLFALLHAQSYTKKLLNQIGPNAMQVLRNLMTKLEAQQVNVLRFIACTEIFLMPAIILMIFTGQASILLPFIYYRFLSLRYASRRNPYCRQLFFELRATTDTLCANARCPAFVRSLCQTAITFISRLAPPVAQ